MDLLDKAIAFASGYWLATCNNTDLFGNEYIDLNITPFDVYEGRDPNDDDLVEVHCFSLTHFDGVFHSYGDYRILGRAYITDDIRCLTTLYLDEPKTDTLYIIDPYTCKVTDSLLGDTL